MAKMSHIGYQGEEWAHLRKEYHNMGWTHSFEVYSFEKSSF